MAIKLKAKETLIQVGKYAGTHRYVLSPELYTKLSEQKVIQEAALRSGLTPATIKAAYDSVGLVLAAWATEGLIVPIPGVGSMRFGVKASSVSNVEKVSANLITARKVIFTPSVAIKNELKATSVTIACYDRNGKLVKTVNSKGDDQGDFEVELIASPEDGGTFEGSGFYNDGQSVVIKAIPAEGYQFVKWDDDEISAERTINVNDNISHVATFKKTGSTDGSSTGSGTSGGNNDGQQSGNQNQGGQSQNRQYTLSVTSANTAQGTVTGGGTYSEGSRVNITATPKSGYQFDKWNDGNTSSTRTIQVSKNESFVAQFKATEQTGGDGTSTGDEDDEHL